MSANEPFTQALLILSFKHLPAEREPAGRAAMQGLPTCLGFPVTSSAKNGPSRSRTEQNKAQCPAARLPSKGRAATVPAEASAWNEKEAHRIPELVTAPMGSPGPLASSSGSADPKPSRSLFKKQDAPVLLSNSYPFLRLI